MCPKPLNVALTGAFGRLGRGVLDELVRRGHRVRCLDLPHRAAKRVAKGYGESVEVVWGSICDAEAVQRVVDGQDVVIHHAAVLPPVTDQQPDRAHAINVDGTRNVLAAIQASPAPPALVYPSSITVHGADPDRVEPVSVSSPRMGSDPYSRHKIACEDLIQASGSRWAIFRVGVSLHPSDRDVSAAALRTLFAIHPEARMEYVHPADVARAMGNLLDGPADRWNRVYMIGGGASCQIRQRDLFEAVTHALGLAEFPAAAFGSAPYYTDWMDTEESERLLQYQRCSFADYKAELHREMQTIRRCTTPVRPLLRWGFLRYSQPWRQRNG